jgi:hypothetical protein
VSLIGLIDTGMFDFFDFFEINIHHLKKEGSLKKDAGGVRVGGKVPRMTVVGTVGVVRAKEGDVASKVMGQLTKRVFDRPYRYRNV